MSHELEKLTITGLGILASRDILNKLLGPTAEYIGEGTRNLVRRSSENIGNIFAAALRKLGRTVDQVGQVNPRILKQVLDEGRFIEDELAAEYFGGLLASSRCPDGRDDSLLSKLNLIKSMPMVQLRLHFALYDVVSRLPYGRDTDALPAFWNGLQLTINGSDLAEVMCLREKYPESLIHEAVLGLIDAELIGAQYALCLGDVQCSDGENVPNEDSLVIRPNEKGASLFMSALGYRSLAPDLITSVVTDVRISKATRNVLPRLGWSEHAYVSQGNCVVDVLGDIGLEIEILKGEIEDLNKRLDDENEDKDTSLKE